jgi:hypothetical protein
MHKQLNQEIQNLKEELDKRDLEVTKFKSSLNTSISSNNGGSGSNGHSGHNHHHHHHSSGLIQTLGTGLAAVNNVMINSFQNIHGSPMNTSLSGGNSHFMTMSSGQHLLDDTLEMENQDRLESWLSIPNKRNIKKHGWKKLYVVLRKGKLFFYNSLKDNQSQDPYMTIDLE